MSLQSNQTAAVSLDTTTTASLRLASITVNAGAGAFTLGGGTTAFMVTLGGAGGTTQTLNNYSSNPFTIGANVSFGGGGGGVHTIDFTGAGNFTCNNSFTPSNAGSGAVFTLADDCTGTVTLTNTNGYTGPTLVNAGILAVTGSGSLSATASIMIASGGAAAMYQSGSSSVTPVTTALGGFQIGSTPGAFGYYNLAGGTINVAGEIDPGGSGGGAGTFAQLDMSGGLINLPNVASSWFLPNRGGSGEASVVNVSGGTISFVNGATGFRPNWSTSQSSTFTISGSARFLSPGANVYLNQTSIASNVSVFNLDGGIFQALGFSNGAFGVLNFNGGYLKAGNAANASYLAGLAAAYVYSTGGTIDNNGQGITIGQALLAPTGSGLLTGTTPVNYSSGFTVPPQVELVGAGSVAATALCHDQPGQRLDHRFSRHKSGRRLHHSAGRLPDNDDRHDSSLNVGMAAGSSRQYRRRIDVSRRRRDRPHRRQYVHRRDDPRRRRGQHQRRRRPGRNLIHHDILRRHTAIRRQRLALGQPQHGHK